MAGQLIHEASADLLPWRAGAAALIAFGLSLFFGRIILRLLRRGGVTEDVSQPDSTKLDEMRRAKKGTPTMGGLMIVASVLLTTLVLADVYDFYVLAACGAMIAVGALGLVDDMLKLRRGAAGVGRVLTRKMKLAITFAVGLAVGYAILRHSADAPQLWGTLFVPVVGGSVALGWSYVAVAAIVFAAVTNAVNLTDGLDGLAAGTAMVAAAVLALVACVAAATFIPDAGELAVLCAALAGALIGFLWYNVYPAQVFMGNVGALAIGGALAVTTLALRAELLFLLFGAVFVVEAASVIMQFAWFKLTRRRIFRCAPFHHHLEFAGWPETRVVQRLWIVSVIGGALALMAFGIR